MRHYEIVAVIHPDQQGRIASMIELYKKIVTDDGGVLHRLEDWGRRSLAYPIQNQHKAQYVMMNVECENATLEKLRENFRFSDSVIRSIVIRRDEAITEPSVMMKQDKKRDDGEIPGDDYPMADAADAADSAPEFEAAAKLKSAKADAATKIKAAEKTADANKSGDAIPEKKGEENEQTD